MEALVLVIQKKERKKNMKPCGVTQRILVAARDEVDTNLAKHKCKDGETMS